MMIKDYGWYLERMGYNKSSREALPSCVQEFFYNMEQQGVLRLSDITPEKIRRHHDYLSERPNQRWSGGLSSSMVYYHMYALKTFMNYQEACGRLMVNPFSVLHFKRPSYPSRMVLTPGEIQQLYGGCETLRDKAMLSLFYGCGLRKSEAIRLNVADLHLGQQLLYVRKGKGRRRRVVPMSQQVTRDLDSYYHYERGLYAVSTEEQAFVLNNQGTRMQDYWRRFKYLAAKAGLPKAISLHNLRHSIATHLLEQGLTIEQVRDFLGHSHLETTQVYTRVHTHQLKL